MTEALRGQIRRRVPAIGWLPRYDRRQLRPNCWPGASWQHWPSPGPSGPPPSQGSRWSSGCTPFRLPHRVRGPRHLASTGGRTGLDRLGHVVIPCCRPPAGQCGAGSAVHDSGRTLGRIVLIAAAQLRIGWVAEFLPKPIATGFLLLTGKPRRTAADRFAAPRASSS